MGSDSVEVMLVVEANGCTDTALCVIPVLRNSLWAPNVFTPGQDNNVLFRPVGEGIISGEMYIYRRNGMLVTHLKDYTVGWDGRCHGKLCPEETYVWVLIYNTARNRRLKAVGTVTLLY